MLITTDVNLMPLTHSIVTFSDEAAMLTISTFKKWYMKQVSTTNSAATDDDLLFFVRNSVDKVENHVIPLRMLHVISTIG